MSLFRCRSLLVILALPLILALVTAPRTLARVIEAGPEDYRAALAELDAGDELHLVPGTYAGGLAIHRLRGRPGMPIVIEGSEGDGETRFLGRSGANTVSISDSSYVTVRNLVIDGQGLPVDGVKCEGTSGPVRHIVLEDLKIVGHGANQQIVGISTKCTAWEWVIRGNVIEGAGTGVYLGNSDGTAPFIAGLIEGNLIVDTVGYNLQVKHQLGQLPLPGLDDGPHETVIRGNVFSKARNGSAGKAARPNVLVGHWPREGPGSDDLYLVYGNLFHQNPTERLFQAEGNVAVYDNLFVNHFGDAVRIQPHHDIPREIWLFHNTVVARDVGLSLIIDPDTRHLTVMGNAVFAHGPVKVTGREGVPSFVTRVLAWLGRRLRVRANTSGSLAEASRRLANPLGEIGELDLYPVDHELEGSPVATELTGMFEGADRDFNGLERDGRYRGAYAGFGLNPGWRPALERIPIAGRW